MSQPDFWDDKSISTKIIKELKTHKDKFDTWQYLTKYINDCKDLIELAEQDDSLKKEVSQEVEDLKKKLNKFEIHVLLSGKFDNEDAIINVNSGAGGTEACDWAGMLFRMYNKWAEHKGYGFEVVDSLEGEEAGIKSVTFIVKGPYVYGYLRSEKGVHRLVRISPFDSSRRRHTSFASVDVIPQISESVDIDINPEDLRIDTFRSSGAGGQHVNVTDSAVRITHEPTGIVVSSQAQRSQHQNKQTALTILKSKLYQKAEEQRQENLDKISGKKRKIEWGSQIRSYVLHPYLMVKDHRTDFQTSNANAVLDGNLDGFIEAYLRNTD